MESKFKIGDYVWAKMKGFPAWPGKVIEPKEEVRRPADKRPKQFVFFFGSENYAWIPDESIWQYVANKARFTLTQRVPRGFREAMESMDDVIRNLPQELQADANRPDEPRTELTSKENKKLKSNRRNSSIRARKSGSAARSPAVSKVARKRASAASPGSLTSPKRNRLVVKVNSNRKVDSSSSPSWLPKTTTTTVSPVQPKRSADQLKPILEVMQQQQQGVKATSPNSTTVANSTSKQESDGRPLSKYDPSPQYDEDDTGELMLPKNIIATPMKIGFLGLGAMGSGMVTNLLNSGHEVTVWNRTPSCCREFVKNGALKGNTPSEVVQACDMTFSCVSDPSALKDLVFGNCGVLQGVGPGKSYIDMSTVDVETITDVHEAVTTRGGRFLEAPVIGSRGPALRGQLLVLTAGDRALYDDCYSCFEAIGRKSFYLGEVGSATKMNLVLSMLTGTVLAGLAESMALAEHMGLDHDDVLKILTMSPVNCPLIRSKGHAMVQAKFSDPHCRLHLCQKNLRLAVNMSDSVEQPLHVASAVNELFKKAKAKGYGDHDSAAVYRAADL